jgi:hypothetical protein
LATADPAVRFSSERLIDAWAETIALREANSAETGAIDPDHFFPDQDKYFEIETHGLLRFFAMRKNGKLVGYSTFLVVPHMHYSNKRFAYQDTLFVQPDCRGFSAAKFIIWTDERLKADRCDFVSRQVTRKKPYSKTLMKLGYHEVETIFMKEF